jgi:hypothetical protein
MARRHCAATCHVPPQACLQPRSSTKPGGDDPLGPEDLACVAVAAYLLGKDQDSADCWTRAYHASLDRGAVDRAARCAFWLGLGLMHLGERARAGAWIARASQLLEDNPLECVERGYLLLPAALQRLFGGDAAGAYAMFCQAGEIAERFRDRDLIALALHSRGRVLIRMGDVGGGLRLLDEAMLAVDADEISPLVVGDVYCSVVEGCLEVFDLRRAQEWTTTLTRWV